MKVVPGPTEGVLVVTYNIEASICVDCDEAPSPEGYELELREGDMIVGRWHRINIGCLDDDCLTKRAARDLVARLRSMTPRPGPAP